MRKYLLPSLIVTVLCAGFALAQNFNRAIQQSQDTTGSILVDTAVGIYFPGHVLSTTQLNPSPTIAGTATPSLVGSDTSGTITMGTSATTATATFGTAFLTAPNCLVTMNSGVVTSLAYNTFTTSLQVSQVATTGNKLTYWCAGQK